MKVVNYVRGEVAAGRDPLAGLAAGPGCCADERYLQPVEPQDPLLFYDFEDVISGWWVGGRVGGCS